MQTAARYAIRHKPTGLYLFDLGSGGGADATLSFEMAELFKLLPLRDCVAFDEHAMRRAGLMGFRGGFDRHDIKQWLVQAPRYGWIEVRAAARKRIGQHGVKLDDYVRTVALGSNPSTPSWALPYNEIEAVKIELVVQPGPVDVEAEADAWW